MFGLPLKFLIVLIAKSGSQPIGSITEVTEPFKVKNGLVGFLVRSDRECLKMARLLNRRRLAQGFAYQENYCYIVSRRLRFSGRMQFRLFDVRYDYRYLTLASSPMLSEAAGKRNGTRRAGRFQNFSR